MLRPAPTHSGRATVLLAALVTFLLAALVTLLPAPSAGADSDTPTDTAGVDHVAAPAGKAALHAGPRGLAHPPPLLAAMLADPGAPSAPGAVGTVRQPGAEAPVPAPAPARWGRAPPAVGTAR